jgi:aldehyde:ferredoxin oxidoreductase
MFNGGYVGQILRVDLTKSEITTEPLNEEVVRAFIGGRGLAGYLFYRECKPGIDPFSPAGKIAFMTGPLQGTATPYTPKFVIANKSPLSGALSRSVSGGGEFGPELKYAGYDGLVVEGRAETPAYLFIDDDKVTIRDARPHWGKSTSETEESIRRELNDSSVKVLPIGPAGENLVRFSGVIPASRAAGRGGAGAVMGSKNLKAIAVRGTGSVQVAQPEMFLSILEEAHQAIKADPQSQGRIDFGTTSTVAAAYRAGALPVMNYSRAMFDGIEGLFAERVKDEAFVHNESCFGCPLPCGKTAIIKSGPHRGTVLQGPQFETIGLLGSNCGINDISAVTRANYLCNQYGLDTISTGNVIAFAIECYQRGVITTQDTDGLPLRFGDPDILLELIGKIAKREGFGDWLAEGTKRLSEKIGRPSTEFAMHSKGQEFASFDPRSVVGMGLMYATATPGANHSYGPTFRAELVDLQDPLTHKEKGRIARNTQNSYCLQDSMIFCSFSRYGLDDKRRFDFIDAVTGWSYSEDQRTIVADRIYTIERLFNLKEGFTKKDDNLPWRSLHEPMPDGPAKGNTVPLAAMLKDYYRERGWDEKNGAPTHEILARLNLTDLVEEIEASL